MISRSSPRLGWAGRAVPFPLPSKGEWAWSVALALLAFCLRFLHLLSLRALPTFQSYVMDEAYHDAWARRLASGNWIAGEPFFRAPLYPYMLGAIYRLFGAGGFTPRLIQGIVGAASVFIVHRIGLKVGDRRAAAVAALLAALCWPLIYFDNELLTTGLELFLSLAAILVLMAADERGRRFGWMLAGGLLIGLAAIARPNMLVLCPAAAAWAAWPAARHPRWRPAAALAVLLGTALAVAPVTLRNRIAGGDLVLIASQGGVNFFIGNNPASDGTTAIVPGTRPTWQGGYDDAISVARMAEGRQLRPSEVSRYWYGRGLAFWKEQPGAAARLLARKAILFLSGTEISNNKDLAFFRELSPILSLPLPATWLLAPLGIAGWWVAWIGAAARRRRVMALPLLFAALYGASIILFFVTSRYRIPVLPVYALGAGLLVAHLLDCARERRWRAAALASSCAVALLVVLNLNPFGYRDDPGQGHLALGIAFEGTGLTDRALEEYSSAASIPGPYIYEALYRKGAALAGTGRNEEACAALRESVRLRPDNLEAISAWLRVAAECGRYAEARAAALNMEAGDEARSGLLFSVGSMDQALGRAAEAEKEYREALRLRADHLGARVNLGLLLRNAGRLDESLAQFLEAERFHPGSGVVQINLAKHYLFTGDREAARRHTSRAREMGAAIPPDFLAALERQEPSRGMMPADTPAEATGVREGENAGSSQRP